MKLGRYFAPLALAAVFATSAAAGQNLTRGPDHDTLNMPGGEKVILPHCTDAEGVRVRFSLVTRQNLQEPLQNVALSIWSPLHGPEVKLRGDILNYPAKTVQAVAIHECGHHVSGDARAAFIDYQNGVPIDDHHEKELTADCYLGVESRRLLGWTPNDLREAFSVFPANENSRTHPPTADRVEHAISCMQKAEGPVAALR